MLSVVQIRGLKPREKPYEVGDADGLFLLVQPSGARLWRFKFKHHGIERKLSLGTFPEVTLQQARAKREEARAKLVDGIDPVEEKQEREMKASLAAATTFRLIADEYIEKMEREGRSPATLTKVRWFRDLLDKDIGHLPMAEITAKLSRKAGPP